MHKRPRAEQVAALAEANAAMPAKAPTAAAAAAAKKQESSGAGIIKVGKFRIHLGRIPELLLLIALAIYVARGSMVWFDMSFPMALPMGLYAARMVQQLLLFLQGDDH